MKQVSLQTINSGDDYMQLYIKRDITDVTSRFVIFDEFCNEKYLVTGVHSGTGEKMQITDLQGEILLTIKKIPLPVLHAYSISDKKTNIKLIVNNNSLKGASCYYYGISWRFRGNIETGSYDIMDADNSVVASHSRRWSACGDGFELHVNNGECELFCIASVVCLNAFLAVDNPAVQTV